MGVIDRCEFRGRAAGAAVVVCPPGLADDALRLLGRVACQGERGCTAWFWDDPAMAPGTPPGVEHPMSREQADAVLAVYIADAGRLCRATPGEQAPREVDDGAPVGRVTPPASRDHRHRQASRSRL